VGRVAPCDPNDRNFCGLDGVEDMAFVPGTDWMLVGSMFINVQTKQRVPLAIPFAEVKTVPLHGNADLSSPECSGPPTSFHAGANDIKRVGSEVHAIVINYQRPVMSEPAEISARIERLWIDMTSGIPEARWLGCFPVPLAYSVNDVAISPRGDIYASVPVERTDPPTEIAVLREKWLAHIPTGFAIEWKHDSGWTKVPGTDVPFANGVGVSLDGRVFAVAGTYCECLLIVDRVTKAVRRIPVGVAPDNITPLVDGGFIAVGNTGAPVTGVFACREPGALPCGFPMAVVQIDPQGLVTYLFESDGSRIPGPSVAVLHGGQLFLGSTFADFVTVVDRPAGAPLH
jgi:hypothetical protein